MYKKISPLILVLLFCGLAIVPKPAFAVFGIGDIGLLDLAMMQLDALDFVEGIILRFFYTLFILLIGTEIFVSVAAVLLQWAISLPINLSDSNALVQAGWNFTSGLTNLFFILALLGIALAYIFKAETWGMKKALPQLIIAALLINFSLLFAQIFAGIFQIVSNRKSGSFGFNFIYFFLYALN